MTTEDRKIQTLSTKVEELQRRVDGLTRRIHEFEHRQNLYGRPRQVDILAQTSALSPLTIPKG
jgi:hypothetical protein